MIGVDDLHILFALRATPPFDRMDDRELLLLAGHARMRSYAPGRLILPAGTVSEALAVARPDGDTPVAWEARA